LHIVFKSITMGFGLGHFALLGSLYLI